MHVIYEDNHIIAVNKEVGDIVQSDKTGDRTLADFVKAHIKAKYNKKGDVFLGIVHRIDRPVSGVIIFARTSKALTRLNKMFQDKEIKKSYWAVVKKKPPLEEETLVNYLRKNEKQNKSYVAGNDKKGAKQASLSYKLIGASKKYFLLDISLHTGRHHQIRAQLAHIGSAIRGDLKYGYDRSNEGGGINLHARKISFIHPVKKELIEIIAPIPEGQSWKMFQGFV